MISFSTNLANASLPSPHMGWNDVYFDVGSALKDEASTPRFYFLPHIILMLKIRNTLMPLQNMVSDLMLLYIDNIYGVQFHQKKSQLGHC